MKITFFNCFSVYQYGGLNLLTFSNLIQNQYLVILGIGDHEFLYDSKFLYEFLKGKYESNVADKYNIVF